MVSVKGVDRQLVGEFAAEIRATRPAEPYNLKGLKYGGEVTYSALSWLAVSGRYDRVIADVSDDSRTLAAFSPRVMFRTDWNSQDQGLI